MKRLWSLLAIIGISMSCIASANAEMMPIEPGTVDKYDSRNSSFQARVTYGEMGMSILALYKGGEQIWSQNLMERPGEVVVSDNGESVVMTTYGWEDEGGIDGLVVYNEKGDLRQQLKFGEGVLKWVDELEVSPNGNFIGVGEGFKETGAISLYEVSTGNLVWLKEVGYNDVVDICLDANAEKIIVATRNVEAMDFSLLNKDGNVIGTKKIDKNFSYDVPVYAKFADNGEAQIYDLKTASFIPADFQ